ncbi:MAG TPA: hypothetical protein H9671_05065 [Firmicutes bacterium]|nr:hypothetical protein [Bacillota bacterium]
MRLFHVSEQSDIHHFEPRIPDRNDLDKHVGLVWAIDEFHLPNFLTPRNCPRVTYHIGENTTDVDRMNFFSTDTMTYAIVIENKWFHIVRSTTLYLYEFHTEDFVLQDHVAGYYVAKTKQIPIAKYEFRDLFSELIKRNVEIRVVDNLWNIADKVKASTLNYSLCRMAFAQPR